MPIGPARAAEPSPGIEVNLAILGAGFAVIAAAPLLLVAPAVVRGRYPGPRGAPRAGRAGRARAPLPAGPGARAGRLGAGQPWGHGWRLSPGQRGAPRYRCAAPWSATAVAVAAVVAAMVFRCQLPRAGRHAATGTGRTGAHELDLSGRLRAADPGPQSPGGDHRPDRLRGWRLRSGQPRCPRQRPAARRCPRIGLDQLRGNGFPHSAGGPGPGRAWRDRPRPAHPARAGGCTSGSRSRSARNSQASQMRVVGSAVFADFSVGGGSATDLGTGARGRGPRPCPSRNPPFLRAAADLLQLFPSLSTGWAPICRAAGRPGDEGPLTRAGCPRGLWPGEHRPAAQRHPELHRIAGTPPLILGAVARACWRSGQLAHVLLTGVRRRPARPGGAQGTRACSDPSWSGWCPGRPARLAANSPCSWACRWGPAGRPAGLGPCSQDRSA